MTILLIGACGSGKTWVMKELIKLLKLDKLGKVGMFYYHHNTKVYVLGKYDGTTFEGSDKLSMAVMRDMESFKIFAKGKTVVAEGDRFTNKTFIEAMKPIVVKIINDGAEGRKLRKSNQTARQIQSIATRVSNVAYKYEVENSTTALKTIYKLVTK
jgi:hypothetical protein